MQKSDPKCLKHDLEQIYFCETCQSVICPECLIEEHMGHKRRILKEVYEERKNEIKCCVNSLNQKIDELKI